MKYKEVYFLQTLKTYLFFFQQPSRSNLGPPKWECLINACTHAAQNLQA